MIPVSGSEKIEMFWDWFVSHEDRIKDAISGESEFEKNWLTESLNNIILDFGLFRWEIGPDLDDGYFLTISPNGNKDLLRLSRSVMALSPGLSDWSFNYAKPINDWDLKFSLYDEYMMECRIDAAKWYYVLLVGSDGCCDLIIEAFDISHLVEDTQKSAVNKVLFSLLGEESCINNLNKIEVVEEIPEEYEDHVYSILELKEHIDEVV